MCRHLGYVGRSTPLTELVFGGTHSLVVQSYAPCDMRGGGTVNVDGFGVGWYTVAEPAGARRYRKPVPIWRDASFGDVIADVHATAAIAAVRSATSGMPVTEAACAPFTDGRWLFSLNGRLAGWPDTAAGLAASLPVTELLTLDAPTDSALLWAVIRNRLTATADPATILSDVVAQALNAAPESRLNLMLTDGATLWASAVTHALSVRQTVHSALVASEPLDADPEWRAVPDRSLVIATPGSIEITSLNIGESHVHRMKEQGA
ncbi:MAG TPA: ergothioneine biosynthesis protein EgtC [Jatrophihabitans sp.]|jgi:glutamine amidotransferase